MARFRLPARQTDPPKFSDRLDSKGKKIESGKVLAKAFAELKEIERLNAHRDVQTVSTRLTSEQIRDAERVFTDLHATGKSLSYVADFFKKNFTPSQSDILAQDAAQEYVERRQDDAEKGDITTAQSQLHHH